LARAFGTTETKQKETTTGEPADEAPGTAPSETVGVTPEIPAPSSSDEGE
jgi:hypothetical protein